MPEPAEVRHLPVPTEVVEARPVGGPAERAIEVLRSVPVPVLAAAGGFVAATAAFVAVRVLGVLRHPRRTLARRRRRKRIEVADTRSFLVDVHLLKK